MATIGNKAATIAEVEAQGWAKGPAVPWTHKVAYRLYIPEPGTLQKFGMAFWGLKYPQRAYPANFGLKLFVYRDQGGLPGALFATGVSLGSSFMDYAKVWYDFDFPTDQRKAFTAGWYWVGAKMSESASYRYPADQEFYPAVRYNENTDLVVAIDTQAYPNVEDPFGPFYFADHLECLFNLTYQPTDTRLYSVSPIIGPNCGNQNVYLTGDNFLVTPTSVKLAGVPALAPYRESLTKIRVYSAPTSFVGTGDVELTFPTGPTLRLADAYTYTALRFDWTDVSPRRALMSGGTQITLTGYGFLLFQNDPKAWVRIGGYNCTFVVVDDNTMIVTTPDVTVNPENEPRWYNLALSIGTTGVDQEFINRANQIELTYGSGFIWLQHADGFVQYPPIPFYQTDANKVVLMKSPARPLVTGFDRAGTTRFLITKNETPPKSPATPFMMVDREYVRPMVSRVKAVNYDPEYYGGDGGGGGGGGGPGEETWPWGDPGGGKLDVVVCMDTTGSMSGRAGNVIQSVRSWLNRIAGRTLDIKVGIVTFGDAWNCGPMLEFDNILDEPGYEEPGYARPVFGFGSPGAASAFLSSVPVGGGEDAPENPLGALNFALDYFMWRWDSRKVALVVTDNPAHTPGDPVISLTGQEFKESYYEYTTGAAHPAALSAWPAQWMPPDPAFLISRLQAGQVLVHTFSMGTTTGYYPVSNLSAALGGVHVQMQNSGAADLSGLPLPGIAW